MISVVEHEPVFAHLGCLAHSWSFGNTALFKGKAAGLNAAIGYVGHLSESTVRNFGSARNSRLRPSDERMQTPFASPAPWHSRMHSFNRLLECPCPFQRTSDPQTVDMNPPVRIDRHPCRFPLEYIR